MSPLTKVFVALLVVLSLLLTAATVTFVSTVDNYRQTALESTTRATNAEQAAAAAAADAVARESQSGQLVSRANANVASLQTELANARQAVADAKAAEAAAKGNLSVAQQNIATLGSAVQTAEATTGQLQTQVASLRESGDTRLGRQAELSRRNTELQNLYDQAERERRFNAEQLAEARRQGQQLSSALKDAGVNPDKLPNAGTGAGAPRIEGVVRSTATVAGIPYATISVGSEDAVRQGMQFNVVSADGRYLGKIEVQTVDPNEAVARIVGGPRSQDIAEGAVVRTQS